MHYFGAAHLAHTQYALLQKWHVLSCSGGQRLLLTQKEAREGSRHSARPRKLLLSQSEHKIQSDKGSLHIEMDQVPHLACMKYALLLGGPSRFNMCYCQVGLPGPYAMCDVIVWARHM
jgi:hypothetical protein